MTNTLYTPGVEAVLGRLFSAAARDDDHAPKPPARPYPTAADRSEAYQDLYLPICAEAGQLLYALTRAIRPRTVVEFGTSFGISTIYLAAAVTDNGTGHILTTELSEKKVETARANLREAGVGAAVTVLAGDARQTLADLPGPVGLVLLDGWKELCLPVLRLLEPKLAPGALVAADDNSQANMADYLGYVRDPANGYVTVSFPVEDGMEISSWTGRPDTTWGG
ncbi:MAG TPA: class I SAM-dependent methyltransferase [Streptosporangiaceae bacterium]|jgi:predicted O-methyltransferase YrrM|nr:class I SAM-dependent methyltransferase [Streptosporangiaceae bacterium]